MRSVITNRCFTFLLILTTAAVVFTTFACSTKKNYKLLNVFFDGVPNPNDQQQNAGQKSGVANPARTKNNTANPNNREVKKNENWVTMKSRHPDFFKNICNNCHDRSSANYLRVDKKEDLCYTCHKPELFTGKYVHGPVAIKACLACHLPHESRYVKLLRDKPEQLCVNCHIHKAPTAKAPETLTSAPDPCSKGKDCTTCHYGHAADNRFFLKQPQEEVR